VPQEALVPQKAANAHAKKPGALSARASCTASSDCTISYQSQFEVNEIFDTKSPLRFRHTSSERSCKKSNARLLIVVLTAISQCCAALFYQRPKLVADLPAFSFLQAFHIIDLRAYSGEWR
jgi:hypothetical protein